MKNFLRENPTIAFGLGLPLLLVLVFLLISGVPTLLVAPPQYDVIYATNYNSYNPQANGLQIAVLKQQVQVNYVGTVQAYQNPRLWRFNPKTGAVREIAIILPTGLTPAGKAQPNTDGPVAVVPVEVPDLVNVTVDSSSLAPDGYRFNNGMDAYSGRMFTGLFYSSRYRDQVELIKDGRSIRLPNSEGAYYGNNVRFIGWVVAP